MSKQFIEKIFVINLKDKEHRWNKFKDIDDRFERFNAIDSRENHLICEDYDLTLDPVGLTNNLYFTQSFGAIGCYLSHYLLWKKMIDENIKLALFLEDDAKHEDVVAFLNTSKQYSSIYDLVQLNKRTHNDIKSYTKHFNGTESYLLTQSGARKLIELTHDHSCLQGIVKAVPLDGYLGLRPSKYECYKHEEDQDWTRLDSITSPVDKFIGYCADSRIPFDERLTILIDRNIQLFCQQVPSDIMDPEDIPFWERDESGINELINSKRFKWWDNEIT
tara:strand:- start:1849 stop:2676 length:828 start_codon:yes stop_codon:yes gene_type:complete